MEAFDESTLNQFHSHSLPYIIFPCERERHKHRRRRRRRMALKWLFSPKCGSKGTKTVAKVPESSSRISTANDEAETPEKAEGEVSEHNTGTDYLENSGSSMDSTAMPSSVVVGHGESSTTVSEIDDGSNLSSGGSTENDKDYMSFREKVGSRRSLQAKSESKRDVNENVVSPRESSKRIPFVFKRSASSSFIGGKSPHGLSAMIRRKLSLGSPDTEALKVTLVVPSESKSSSPATRSPPATKIVRSKSLANLSLYDDRDKKKELQCDHSPTSRRRSLGNGTGTSDSKGRDQCPELPHRQVSMGPKEIKRRHDSKGKTKKPPSDSEKKKKKRRSDSKEKSPKQSGPNVPPEVIKSYKNQLQTRRKKNELVRKIRGKRAEETETKRKQFSSEEMAQYLEIIQEVRMAKKQAKSRAMQEAMALQRADFLARLIHVSETENKAANPVTPLPSARI